MNSKLAFLIPIISLIYFIDTIRNKTINRVLKIILGVFSLSIVLLDLLIAAVFYLNCWDASRLFQNSNCIGWIYPTIDFKLMIVLSMVIFTFSIFGLIKKWHRGIYFLFGSIIIYTGTALMIYILNDAKSAISMATGTNTIIILDIFSIVVVYGLVASMFYFAIFFIGLFTKYTLRPKQV